MAEPVINVQRGGRSDLDLERAVANQLRHWAANHTKVNYNDLTIALAVQLIADKLITPEDSGDVQLSRDDVLVFLGAAGNRLDTIFED